MWLYQKVLNECFPTKKLQWIRVDKPESSTRSSSPSHLQVCWAFLYKESTISEVKYTFQTPLIIICGKDKSYIQKEQISSVIGRVTLAIYDGHNYWEAKPTGLSDDAHVILQLVGYIFLTTWLYNYMAPLPLWKKNYNHKEEYLQLRLSTFPFKSGECYFLFKRLHSQRGEKAKFALPPVNKLGPITVYAFA